MKKHLSTIIFILCFVVGFVSMQIVDKTTQNVSSWTGNPMESLSEIDHTEATQSNLFDELANTVFQTDRRVFYLGSLQEIVVRARDSKRNGIFRKIQRRQPEKVHSEFPVFIDEQPLYGDEYEYWVYWKQIS